MSRRVARRRTFTKGGSKTMHKIARQEAKKVVNKEVETKFVDGALNLDGTQEVSAFGFNAKLTKDWSASGQITSSNGVEISQGTGADQYIGSAIHPVYISINWSIENATGMVPDSFNTISIMVIQAKGYFLFDPINTANQLTAVNTITAPLGMLPREYNDRYRILYHKVFTVDADDPIKAGRIRIPTKKLRKLVFNDDIGTVEANPIVLSVRSDSTASPNPTMTAFWRFYFKDA